MKARYINEKFTEDGDPIYDMGIGIRSTAIEEIFKEDKKYNLCFGAIPGNIFSIIVSGAAGRGQQHKTGKRFIITFYSNNMYFQTKKLKDGSPKRMSGNDKKYYAIELVTRAGIAEFFSDVDYNPHDNNVVIFKIKEEYRKVFRPGNYGPDMYESVNEKFIEDTDPVQDMGIGVKNQIQKDIEKIGLTLEDVNIDDDFLITCNRNPLWGTGDQFRDIQLKYLSEERRKLAKDILRIEILYGMQRTAIFKTIRIQTLEECIKEAVDNGMSADDITKYIKTFGSYELQKEARFLIAKLTRSKKKIKEDSENNVYVFIGYIEKSPVEVNGKKYYEDKFQVEKMVKIKDTYNYAELAQVDMMKTRAQAQYGGQSGSGVFMLNIPKFIMDEDYYNEIPEEHRDIIEKYKTKI